MPKKSKTALPTSIPEHRVTFDPQAIKPQWFHPLLGTRTNGARREVTKRELEIFAYDYYLRFLPFFRGQREGTINSGVLIEFTNRMKSKLGLAYLFEHKIKLNQKYFGADPSLLPYTLFHEMTHIWLYDCFLDPGHTRRFYNKMAEFEQTGLPVDPDVHIHTRVSPECKHVYYCPNCTNRWYLREPLKHSIYCGYCHDHHGQEYYARKLTEAAQSKLTARFNRGPAPAA